MGKGIILVTCFGLAAERAPFLLMQILGQALGMGSSQHCKDFKDFKDLKDFDGTFLLC